MNWDFLERRPVVIAIAGPNGAGKSTFYSAHLAKLGLPFVNADELGRSLGLDAYTAAAIAGQVREQLMHARESFVFETVFSDPVGDKVEFLVRAREAGYSAVVCYIWIPNAETSEERVAMRIVQGGHDVPNEKIKSRFGRTLDNLKRAIEAKLPVFLFDNSDLQTPFRLMAVFDHGGCDRDAKSLPDGLRRLLGQ